MEVMQMAHVRQKSLTIHLCVVFKKYELKRFTKILPKLAMFTVLGLFFLGNALKTKVFEALSGLL